MTFKEIRRCLDGAVIPFGGKISKGLKASPAVVEIAPGWQALGFSTSSVERASGQHARHLLAVVEEASGVDDWVVLDVVLSNSGLAGSRRGDPSSGPQVERNRHLGEA